jgi:ATP-dependent DNA helicase DinG
MVLLEAEVHSSLLSFLRQGKQNWPHHLTMARIISRALRLRRSALIQTGSPFKEYCLSYLTPALLSETPLLLVAPDFVRQHLLQVEIPQLQEGLQTSKEIRNGDRLSERFNGLMLTSPQAWLSDRLENLGRFPSDLITIIDRADDLEEWTKNYLTVAIEDWQWDALIQHYAERAESIRDTKVRLTKAIFSHPKNPYECYLVEEPEQAILKQLLNTLNARSPLVSPFLEFWQRWQSEGQIMWATSDRTSGRFTLAIAPVEVNQILSPIWQQQPIVFLGSFLDSDKKAATYRQQLGLKELLSLKFLPNRQNESIRLYVPDRFPLPNTPDFQTALLHEVSALVKLGDRLKKTIVVLVEDVPLKARVGAIIAAQFGTRVRVEKFGASDDSILICGWQFWHENQEHFPTPQLLVIATLPIPSLENPLVAGRVGYYKSQHQDWFRLYLLPAALRDIQRAVMSLRSAQGIVALLDNRVNLRSYGSLILTALEPYARMNYLDPSWFKGDEIAD